MKVHVFEAQQDGKWFFAFARDRPGSLMKSGVTINNSVAIDYADWAYMGVYRTDTTTNDPLDEKLHNGVRRDGLVVTTALPKPSCYHVFELKLDAADLRIYSDQRSLENFRNTRHRLELGPEGRRYEGGAEEYIGEVSIPDPAVAAQMKLNYVSLRMTGVQVKAISNSSVEEFLRRKFERALKRELPLKAAQLGIRVVELGVKVERIGPETAGRPEPSQATPPQTANAKQALSVVETVEKPSDQKNEVNTSLYDRVVKKIKDNPIMVGAIFVIITIGAVAATLEGVDTILSRVSKILSPVQTSEPNSN